MSNNKNWSNTRSIMQRIIENPSYNAKESISQWIGNIGTNQDTMLLLVGNKSVSEDFVVNKTIQALFDTGIFAHITAESLSKQSLAEIVNGKLFLYINHIPKGEEEQQKLKELIISVVIHKAIISDGYKIPTQAKIIVTIDEAHEFFRDFLELCTTLFIDSKENILSKFKVNSTTPLYQAIESSLDYYSDEIRVMEKEQLDIRVNENKRYIESLIETNSESPSSEKLVELPILDPYSDNFEKYFPLGDFHTYIMGLTRMGKSMFLLTLFMKYIQNKESVTILFDIHGDLAQKAKMLVKEKERLLYISNSLNKSYAASINLFKIDDKSEKNITKIANVILGVLKQIKADESFSGAMEELLLRCIRVLIRKGDGSFHELYRFMNDKRNSDLIQYAKSCGNPLDEEYFSDYFNDTNTKNAIRRRLGILLSDEDFINMMSGDNKLIDFEKEFNTPGKIIIIDIAKGKMDSYVYYIRFIIEYILVLALKRVNIPKEERVKTQLILDEFDNFLSANENIKTIFKEAGKYNLFLTIANQIISDIKDNSFQDTVLSMTGAKVMFKNSNITVDTLNKTLKTKLDLNSLNIGECYISVLNNEIIKAKNTNRFLNNLEEISIDEWKVNEEYQLTKNYRLINSKNLQPTEVEINEMIKQFKTDLISKNLIETSCLHKLEISAPERFKEIKNDFEFRTPKDNEYKPRIRQQEISVIFSLAFELDYTFDNAKFIQMLKGENDMFNQSNSGTRTAEFTIDGKSKTEQYYYFQW